jgi:Ca2+/Na+ antiporter
MPIRFLSVIFLAAALLGFIKFILSHSLNIWEFLGALITYLIVYVAVIYFAFIKR